MASTTTTTVSTVPSSSCSSSSRTKVNNGEEKKDTDDSCTRSEGTVTKDKVCYMYRWVKKFTKIKKFLIKTFIFKLTYLHLVTVMWWLLPTFIISSLAQVNLKFNFKNKTTLNLSMYKSWICFSVLLWFGFIQVLKKSRV